MSNNYDNWERLVSAVLLREKLRQIALCPSIDSSCVTSASSSFRLSSTSPINDSFHFTRAFQLPESYSGAIHNPKDHDITSNSTSVFFDERTGKKCVMVGAEDLKISLRDITQFWKWKPHSDSRFPDISELKSAWQLDIRGKIKTTMLHPWTVYTAFLVYKITERTDVFEPAKAMVRFVNDESDRNASKRAHVVNLQPAKMKSWDDGWMELEIGNFYVDQGDNGEVEARLLASRRSNGGLIVEGILFRPTLSYTDAPLVSKKYMSKNAWG